jgi:uncharacterized membrane protein YfcA
MIQRIQSVYLFLAAAITLALFALPLFHLSAAGQVVTIYGCHVKPTIDGISTHIMVPVAIILSLSVLFSLYAIFLFKNRKKQILVIRINYLIIIAATASVIIMALRLSHLLQQSLKPSFGIILPLVVLILLNRAINGIKKDEELVKSADRLR